MLTKKEILNNLINDKQQFKNSHSLAKKINIPDTHKWCKTKAEYVYCFLNDINTEPICTNCNKEKLSFPSFKKGYNPTCKNHNCIYQHKQKNKDNSKYTFIHTKDNFFKYIIKNNKIEVNKYFNNIKIPEEYKWCENKSEYIYNIINEITEKPLCPICKKNNLGFKSFTSGYFNYCSTSCSMKDKKVIEKIENTTLEKYGVKNISQSNEIKEKKKNTLLNNYGVESPLKSREIQEKVKKSIISKYGVENASQSNIIKEKKKKTTLDNYNVEVPLQSKEIQKKVRNTNLEKYGHISTFHKDVQKRNKLFFEKLIRKWFSFDIKILIDFEDYKGTFTIDKDKKSKRFKRNDFITKNIYNFECLKCGNIFKSHIYDGRIPVCRKCNPKSINVSSYEKEIQVFLDEHNIKYKSNNRNIISPLELDIYFEDKKLAIEFNGLYYHSYQMLNATRNNISNKQIDLYKKHKLSPNVGLNFHLLKTKLCEEKGINLFHIYEIEWIEKKEIIKSMILNKLGLINNNLNARDTYVKEVSYKDSINFLDNNHIQGKTNSRIRLGLYLKKDINGYKKDTLVSLMSFSNNKNSITENIELDRYCNLINTNIRGAASKLFKYFLINYSKKGDKIVSFADQRYSQGKLYNQLNFEYIYTTKPNYKYVKNMNLYTRKTFQKQNIEKYYNIFKSNDVENTYYGLIKKYNEELTEYENMLLNGYDKIFDSGQIKFVYYV